MSSWGTTKRELKWTSPIRISQRYGRVLSAAEFTPMTSEACSRCIADSSAPDICSVQLVPGSQVGVYANAFVPEPPSDEPYAGISELRADLTPQRYLEWAREWINLGATIIGGCCGIGPEHIAALRDGLR